jgi:hypothetical protein
VLNSLGLVKSGPSIIKLRMSLQSFQQALCDLIASPNLSHKMRTHPEDVLRSYDLTLREQHRLVEIVSQPGMSTNCTLYRVNRITPIYTFLPLTCFILGDSLKHEIELFWESYQDTDLQFKQEIDHFTEFLMGQVRAAQIENPFLKEVLEFEMAVNELRFLPRHHIANTLIGSDQTRPDTPLKLHPLVKLAQFRHDPSVLLKFFGEMHPLPDGIEEGEFYLLLDATGDDLQVKNIPSDLWQLLHNIQTGRTPFLAKDDAEALIDAKLIVHVV